MLSVCSTRPVHGAAKYSSRWRAVFQAKVATRPSSRDAEVVEHAAEPAGALGPLAVGRALAAGGGGGDDLLVREQPLGPVEEVRQRERVVLHQTLHGGPPRRAMRATGRPDGRLPRSWTLGRDDAGGARRRTSRPRRCLILAPLIVADRGRRRPSATPCAPDAASTSTRCCSSRSNARNRNLVLASRPSSTPWSYYLVGGAPAAGRPTRSSTCSAAGTATPPCAGSSARRRTLRRHAALGRAVVRQGRPTRSSLIAPNNFICLFAGAAGMSPGRRSSSST